MKIIVLALVFALSSLNFSHAQEVDYLTESQSAVLESVLDNQTVEAFQLHNVAVLTRLEVEIAVPWIANLTIWPEIELHWSR